MLQYGPQLRQQRAAFSEMLNPRSVSTYETLMEHETVKLLSEVLASPPPSAKQSSDSVRLQIKRYIASLVFTLTYGQKLADDENLHAVLEVLDTLLMDAAPGAHLVDTFPILDNLPDFLSPWRREANEKHHRESSLYLRLARSVRTDIQAGIAPDCFASQLWQQFDQGSLDEETLAYVAGSAFEASIHTTSGTLMWFVMAMRLHPVEQAKAQREIDQLLLEHSGSALEMPSLSMLTQLPYCVALIKEVLRWQPVAPGAFPHVATADYEYKGEDPSLNDFFVALISGRLCHSEGHSGHS
jgi:cytochrome P450